MWKKLEVSIHLKVLFHTISKLGLMLNCHVPCLLYPFTCIKFWMPLEKLIRYVLEYPQICLGPITGWILWYIWFLSQPHSNISELLIQSSSKSHGCVNSWKQYLKYTYSKIFRCLMRVAEWCWAMQMVIISIKSTVLVVFGTQHGRLK